MSDTNHHLPGDTNQPRNFCLDIGGSFIKLGIGNAQTLNEIGSVPTPTDTYRAYIGSIVDLLLSNGFANPDRLGISITGVIDRDKGAVNSAQLPFLASVNFCKDLASALRQENSGLVANPIIIENDADCFAIAEATHGAGRGFDNVFAIILGTGVGGAQIYQQNLIRGFGGSSGEWGHGPFVQNQDGTLPDFIPQIACTCGQKGCVNTIGGARGLEAIHRTSGKQKLNSQQIIDGWAAADADCSRTVARYVSIVGNALALTLNITGAQIVPAGGGLSNAPALLEALNHDVQGKILQPRPDPLIVKGTFGKNGGLWGINALLLNQARQT